MVRPCQVLRASGRTPRTRGKVPSPSHPSAARFPKAARLPHPSSFQFVSLLSAPPSPRPTQPPLLVLPVTARDGDCRVEAPWAKDAGGVVVVARLILKLS